MIKAEWPLSLRRTSSKNIDHTSQPEGRKKRSK